MTILADFLRDNQGNVLRVFPDSLGELHITSDQWESASGGWSDPTYTIPVEGYEYRTLADSAGKIWYVFYVIRVEDEEGYSWELMLSDVAPTAQPSGVWRDPKYGTTLVENHAAIGNEIFVKMGDISGTSWYVYPTIDGEYRISTTMPV